MSFETSGTCTGGRPFDSTTARVASGATRVPGTGFTPITVLAGNLVLYWLLTPVTKPTESSCLLAVGHARPLIGGTETGAGPADTISRTWRAPVHDPALGD